MVEFLGGIAAAIAFFALAWYDWTHDHWSLRSARRGFEERPYGWHRWTYLAQWVVISRVVPALLVVGGVAWLVFAVGAVV